MTQINSFSYALVDNSPLLSRPAPQAPLAEGGFDQILVQVAVLAYHDGVVDGSGTVDLEELDRRGRLSVDLPGLLDVRSAVTSKTESIAAHFDATASSPQSSDGGNQGSAPVSPPPTAATAGGGLAGLPTTAPSTPSGRAWISTPQTPAGRRVRVQIVAGGDNAEQYVRLAAAADQDAVDAGSDVGVCAADRQAKRARSNRQVQLDFIDDCVCEILRKATLSCISATEAIGTVLQLLRPVDHAISVIATRDASDLVGCREDASKFKGLGDQAVAAAKEMDLIFCEVLRFWSTESRGDGDPTRPNEWASEDDALDMVGLGLVG
jgi:hypothetical protein